MSSLSQNCTSTKPLKSIAYSPQQLFWAFFCVTLLIKLAVASLTPLTGDEAYYHIWGMQFDWGYYDHPPMIGWIMNALFTISDSVLMMRLPAVLLSSCIGFGIYSLLKRDDIEKAALIGVLYLISPVNLLGVLVATDTPLIFFSFLSALCFYFALRNYNSLFYFVLSGMALGCAFLSKYLAVILAVTYCLMFLLLPKSKKRSLGFLLLFIAVLPFGLINLYWNYTHGWANVMFNAINRNENATLNFQDFGLYLLTMFYLMTPPLFYYFFKYRARIVMAIRGVSQWSSIFNVFTALFVFPILLFLVVSLFKRVGLHWPLAFITFFYISAYYFLSRNEIIKSIKLMLVFSMLHLVLFGLLYATPMEQLAKLQLSKLGLKGKSYSSIVFFFKHKEIRDSLNVFNDHFIIATPSYSKSVIFAFDSKKHVPNLGVGSFHGRHDDLVSNFAEYEGKDFLIFSLKKQRAEGFRQYFSQSVVEELEFYGAKFYLTYSYDFHYPLYRDKVLKVIYNEFWQTPEFLPHKGNIFYDKYWG